VILLTAPYGAIVLLYKITIIFLAHVSTGCGC
jgi:hypothetical protein